MELIHELASFIVSECKVQLTLEYYSSLVCARKENIEEVWSADKTIGLSLTDNIPWAGDDSAIFLGFIEWRPCISIAHETRNATSVGL